ncbi:protein phosphatase 2C-like domain-containing protein 1 [Rhynchocyon petersi]
MLKTEDHDDKQISKEEVTFPCSFCKHEIDLRSLFSHKKLHKGLASLNFHWMGGKKPQRPEIIAQRQFLISKLVSSSLFNERVLQSINNAFELIWKKQIPDYYKIVDNIASSSMYSPQICHVLIKAVAICEDKNASWRSDMDDKFTLMNNFGQKNNVLFFGLFSGHHGGSAAELTSVELPVLILHQISRIDPSYQMSPEEQKVIDSFSTLFKEEYTQIEDQFSFMPKRIKAFNSELEGIHKGFAKAFWRMDRILRLGRKEGSRVQWSGCSAVTCILEGAIKTLTQEPFVTENGSFRKMPEIISGTLHVANTGDIQAVLCRNGIGFCLTKDHTTKNIMERRRVLHGGAKLGLNETDGMLEGQMKTTRGLGFHGNAKLKRFLIPAPQTISVPIDDLCQFLILATNGLWEVLDKKEVVTLAMTMFHTYKEKCHSIAQKDSSPPTLSKSSIRKSESSIYTVYQYQPSKDQVSSRNSKENLSDLKYSEHSTCNFENLETFPPQLTNHEPCSSWEKTDGRGASVEDMAAELQEQGKEACTKGFYEAAAGHMSRELVKAALGAGSRNNITVMVLLLSGSEYQFSM